MLPNRTFSLGRFVFPLRTDLVISSRELFFYPSKNYLFASVHTTIWKFESKNSQEYHHMVRNGVINRPVEKRSIACMWHDRIPLDHVIGDWERQFKTSDTGDDNHIEMLYINEPSLK